MRRLMLVVVAVVLAVPAIYAASFVSVSQPHITLLSRDRLRAACHSDKQLNACTNVDVTLLSSCEASSSLYHIDAHVLIEPSVFTISHTILPHEMSHLADLASLFNAYAQKLRSKEFETRRDCEAVARVANMTFGQRVRAYQQISAVRRDHEKGQPQMADDTAMAAATLAALGD